MFHENARHHHGNTAIGNVILRLSNADYGIVGTHTGGERPSIQLDRPYLGIDALDRKTTDHGGKLFGSCELDGCRLYWAIPVEAGAAA
jgi:hypothetical protein